MKRTGASDCGPAVPVVSAVGHEIDLPSAISRRITARYAQAAAEIITAGVVALEDSLITTRGRLQRLVAERCARERTSAHWRTVWAVAIRGVGCRSNAAG